MRWTESDVEFDSRTWWQLKKEIRMSLHDWGFKITPSKDWRTWRRTAKRTPELERYLTMLALAGHL